MQIDDTNPRGEPASVTVAVPTLNRPRLCELAIRSVLDQRDAVCQLLISENASDAQHAEEYGQLFDSLAPPARVIRQRERLNVEEHLARLLALVDTDYVIVLADDDVLSPTFVARALDAAQRSGAGAVFGPYRLDYKMSGRSVIRDHDFTHRSRFLRMSKFLCSRDDAFIYGLFRTDVLKRAIVEFRPLQILGRRTLIRIAYAPLFVCLLAAPYVHLSGEAVRVNTADSTKSEAYLGENNARKVVELMLGEWILALRFVRLAKRDAGLSFALGIAPVIAAAAVRYCAAFGLQAVQRLVNASLLHWRRLP